MDIEDGDFGTDYEIGGPKERGHTCPSCKIIREDYNGIDVLRGAEC